MNILAGDATIDQLFKKGYILHLSDMYDLTKEQLLTLDGWKDLSAERFLKSIENSKKAPFSAVLFALGIRHIGENTAKVLASHFKSVQALAAASEQELDEMDEIGPVLSRSIREYFADARHIVLINRLKADGLRFEQEEEQKISDILAGKTVVVTGTYSIPRDAMKKLISQNGGKNTSSVSASTSYLLTGTKPGPDKVKKAEKLGVKMMTEEEFHSLINDGH